MTYNDPVIFLEYAVDVADACRARGIRAVAVTAGYIGDEPRRELFAHIDAANVDLKAFTEDFYRRVSAGTCSRCWTPSIYLRHETDVWFEITTLLIPGHNDSDAEIDAECAWIAANLGPDVPLHFTAFHPDFKMRDVPPTPPATLRRARRDRAATRAALRLHRQRPRRRGRPDHLPRLRRGRGRARTGTSSAATSSPTTAAAPAAAPPSPAATTDRSDGGGRAGCRCRWPGRGR